MTAIEKDIVKNVWRFDPVSLLHLLLHLGFNLNEIFFCSNYTTCSQSRILESVKFYDTPRKVLIELNLGLLGAQSVLPDYFFKQVDVGIIDARQFVAFFKYFDHLLLRNYILALYPELNEKDYKSWESRKHELLFTMRLDSTSSLHWLTQLVFPELLVRVEKSSFNRNIELGNPVLGKAKLGYHTVFGKNRTIPVTGKRITLITDEDNYINDRPWTEEINHRLEKLIFPVLRKVGLDLEIWLVNRAQGNWLSLNQGSYLGFDTIISDNLQFRRIRIFSGRLFD